jgi:pSer/pThr/pTyr-binding forkhead associated (FHA) protein
MTEDGEFPNDIVLPSSDRAISRTHCTLDYSNFLRRRVDEAWLAFLACYHPRLGRHSVFHALPQDMFRYILDFIKEPRAIQVSDLGSVFGTYLRITSSDSYPLSTHQQFLIGKDLLLDIESVTNEPALLTEASDDSTLLDYSESPQLKLSVCKQSLDDSTQQKMTYCFIPERGFRQVTIGRSQMCDIQVSDTTISRIQCRIEYSKSRWCILDGSEQKPSVNGTWLSLCDNDRSLRRPSRPFSIANGAQLKVSESLLSIVWD